MKTIIIIIIRIILVITVIQLIENEGQKEKDWNEGNLVRNR